MIAASLLVAACSTTSSPADVDGQTGTVAHCSGVAPELEAAPPYEPPTSKIAMAVRVPRSRLQGALEQRVPEELARGGQKVSVGRLSYSVKRGAIGIELAAGDLVVKVPIQIHAGVCVPFGPVCPSVGGCSPKLTTTVHVPLRLDERYRLTGSRVATAVHRGCVIAGYDATGQIHSHANRQSRNLKRQLDQSLPSIRPEMHALWTRLHEPVPIGEGRCVIPRPLRVEQRTATMEDDELVFRLDLLATLRQRERCGAEANAEKPPALPAPKMVAPSDESATLSIPARLAWDEVSQELTRALSQPAALAKAPVRVQQVRARGVSVPTAGGKQRRSRIALALAIEGAECGPLWVLADGRYDSASGRVRLQELTLVDSQRGAAHGDSFERLAPWLAEHAALTIEHSVDGIAGALREVTEQAANRRTERVTVGTYATEPLPAQLTVAAEGLFVARPLAGEIPLTVK